MSTAFQLAVELARLANKAAYLESCLVGEVEVNEESIPILEALTELEIVKELKIDGKSKVGESLSNSKDQLAEFSIFNVSGSGNGGYLSQTFDELLDRPETCSEFPEEFYIRESDFLSWEKVEDERYKNYKHATELCVLLEDLSDFPNHDKLSFVTPSRWDIQKKYREDDLKQANLNDVEQLVIQLKTQKDHHTERRREIFIHCISNQLESIDRELRLGYLIRHLNEVYKKYRTEYEIYARDFSHNKLVADFDSQRTAYIERTQKIINDISAKVLSIPLAYILIAGQLSDQAGMKNHIILVGAVIFVLLITIMILFQFSVLNHINQDVKSLKDQYKDNIDEEPFKSKFSQLTSKIKLQRAILGFIVFVIFLVFYLVYRLYSQYTDPTILEMLWNYLCNFVKTDVVNSYQTICR